MATKDEKREIMAMVQKPTRTQIRQHALDRALQPDVVQKVARKQYQYEATASEFAEDIVKVASVFEEYLSVEE